jgi:uracil-DNA glycosylase family 4
MVNMSFELFQYYNRPKGERQFIMDEIKKGVQMCEKCPDLVESRQLYAYGKPTFGYGNINSPILFIGEAPGKWGCGVTGIPFTGDRSGDYFQKMLHDGLSIKLSSVYTTNIVKCCPKDNRTPTDVERNNCLQFLMTELKYVQPFLIVTLGMSATKVFFPDLEQFFKIHGREHILGDDGEVQWIGGLYKWSSVVPHDCFIYPTWHPSFVMRDTPHLEERYLSEFRKMEKLLNLAFRQWGPRN